MKDCEPTQGCIFFNDKMQNMPATANILKKKYCKEEYLTCARYSVAKSLGRGKVPADLFPQQTERSEMLINEG